MLNCLLSKVVYCEGTLKELDSPGACVDNAKVGVVAYR